MAAARRPPSGRSKMVAPRLLHIPSKFCAPPYFSIGALRGRNTQVKDKCSEENLQRFCEHCPRIVREKRTERGERESGFHGAVGLDAAPGCVGQYQASAHVDQNLQR